MSMFPNPMDGLLSFQYALSDGMPFKKLDAGYLAIIDEVEGRRRFCYAKVTDGEVQALATFRQEDPIRGVDCFSVNYSVSEKHRGFGFAAEAVNKGIEELKKEFSLSKMRSFIVDAFIDVNNIYSIKVAEKLFVGPGKEMMDSFSGTPSLYFRRMIAVR